MSRGRVNCVDLDQAVFPSVSRSLLDVNERDVLLCISLSGLRTRRIDKVLQMQCRRARPYGRCDLVTLPSVSFRHDFSDGLITPLTTNPIRTDGVSLAVWPVGGCYRVKSSKIPAGGDEIGVPLQSSLDKRSLGYLPATLVPPV